MTTTYQLRNKIRNLKEQITECEDEIAGCRHKMELSENALFQVQNKRNEFEGFFGERRNKIRRISESFPNMSFLTGFQEELAGFMEGAEYQRAVDGYAQAEWSLRNKRDMLACHESDLRYEISRKEAELESLQRKLRYMEQEE